MSQHVEQAPTERRRTRILIAAVVGTIALSWAYAMAFDAVPDATRAAMATTSR